jgi:hypothetical protein
LISNRKRQIKDETLTLTLTLDLKLQRTPGRGPTIEPPTLPSPPPPVPPWARTGRTEVCRGVRPHRRVCLAPPLSRSTAARSPAGERAGEGASGGAAALSSRPPWAAHSLSSRFLGLGKRGRKRKHAGWRTPVALGQAVRILAVAGERRPRAARTRRRRCGSGSGVRKEMARVSQSGRRARLLSHRKARAAVGS